MWYNLIIILIGQWYLSCSLGMVFGWEISYLSNTSL